MDGCTATSNLMNLTSFEKAILCQALRALSDYTISGFPPNTRKNAPLYNAHPCDDLDSIHGVHRVPTCSAPQAPLNDAKSNSLLRMVRRSVTRRTKTGPYTIGDRPLPDYRTIQVVKRKRSECTCRPEPGSNRHVQRARDFKPEGHNALSLCD